MVEKLVKAAPALGRLGWTLITLVALVLLLCLLSFCVLVILRTSPATLLYPLGALV